MDHTDSPGMDRRRLLGLAAGAAAAAPLVGTRFAHADQTPDTLPPDTLPGGAYDRYVAQLAADGQFAGVVLLSYRGRTVLSRSYGMADRERGIPNHEGIAFNLSSAGKPFGAVAMLQLAQQGKVQLSDTVGTYLTGFAPGIAEQVTIHDLLAGTSGLGVPDEDVQRIFHSRDDVQAYWKQWVQQATQIAPPGTPIGHDGADIGIPALILEAVTGMAYWDYVQEHVFRRCGMTGTGFYTRPQWLTDEHIAHAYMTLADGSQVDAVRNLDQSSPFPDELGKNPGRTFIAAPGDAGFATAPDLVRFAHALTDGTVLDRPWVELLTGAKIPHGGQPGQPAPPYPSFGAYDMPVHIVNGQWVWGRGGANPGVGASWNIYPDSGWVGVTLANIDGVPLAEMSQREIDAVTGAVA